MALLLRLARIRRRANRHLRHGFEKAGRCAKKATRNHQDRPMATIPARMTAIGIRAPGGPEVLVPEERPVPTPGADEILVAVEAAGVNRPDVMQRQGLYPPPKGAPDIPGLEIAGQVVACGAGVQRWREGEHIAALVIGGGYAQY